MTLLHNQPRQQVMIDYDISEPEYLWLIDEIERGHDIGTTLENYMDRKRVRHNGYAIGLKLINVLDQAILSGDSRSAIFGFAMKRIYEDHYRTSTFREDFLEAADRAFEDFERGEKFMGAA